MKKMLKQILAFTLVIIITVTMGALPGTSRETFAASSKVYIPTDPYTGISTKRSVVYMPEGEALQWVDSITIVGCDKASQIKKLKSSNPSVVSVEAQNGWIKVLAHKKAGTAKITCTVKNVKLSATCVVRKYTNPVSSFKIGNTNYTSKFNKYDLFIRKNTFKNQTLYVKPKKGWVIESVHIQNGVKTKSFVKKMSSFKKKISMTNPYDGVVVGLYNSKTKVYEAIYFRYE